MWGGPRGPPHHFCRIRGLEVPAPTLLGHFGGSRESTAWLGLGMTWAATSRPRLATLALPASTAARTAATSPLITTVMYPPPSFSRASTSTAAVFHGRVDGLEYRREALRFDESYCESRLIVHSSPACFRAFGRQVHGSLLEKNVEVRRACQGGAGLLRRMRYHVQHDGHFDAARHRRGGLGGGLDIRSGPASFRQMPGWSFQLHLHQAHPAVFSMASKNDHSGRPPRYFHQNQRVVQNYGPYLPALS